MHLYNPSLTFVPLTLRRLRKSFQAENGISKERPSQLIADGKEHTTLWHSHHNHITHPLHSNHFPQSAHPNHVTLRRRPQEHARSRRCQADCITDRARRRPHRQADRQGIRSHWCQQRHWYRDSESTVCHRRSCLWNSARRVQR